MKVFISHAGEDRTLVRKIAAILKEAGMDVWVDSLEIMPGENWAEKIAHALKESEAMIVLLTPGALESKWMRWEIEYALGNEAYNKRLIPVLVGNPDQFPEESIPWILRRLNMINLPEQGEDEENIRQIAQALKEVA